MKRIVLIGNGNQQNILIVGLSQQNYLTVLSVPFSHHQIGIPLKTDKPQMSIDQMNQMRKALGGCPLTKREIKLRYS